MLVVIGILSVLFGILLATGSMARNSRRQSSAQQQLATIAAAINRYAQFWPPWRVAGVTVADKGWPDFIPGRLFPSGTFQPLAGYNDTSQFALLNDDLDANTCLVYCLLAPVGGGPYLQREDVSLIPDERGAGPGQTASYPSAGGAARPRELLVDAWGTPLRYFWVYRDTFVRTSYNGYLPVDYAAFVPGGGSQGGVDFDLFYQDAAARRHPKRAVGFVLESAGPDRKFGNVWKPGPSPQEISEAADNPVIKP